MTDKEKNDFFYVCSLIEFIARQTKNKRGTIVMALGKEGIEKQLYDAEVNHCQLVVLFKTGGRPL